MYRSERKIPTFLALVILILGIGGVIFLNQSTLQTGSSASPASRPEEIHFTNISDTSFVVSWFTSIPTTGTMTVNDNGHTISYLDDTDSDNISRPRITHFITVKNLKENSSLKAKIISGDAGCKIAENCPTFEQKTGNFIGTALSLPAARGSILGEDNKPATEAIVYLIIGKSPPLSGKTDTAGLWVIPLSNLRTADLLTRPNLSDNDIVQIIAKISPDKKTEAVTDVKSIRQNLTIPPLQIGKSYNLIDLISKKDLLAGLNMSNNILGTQAQIGSSTNTSSIATSRSVDILFPAYDDDTTTDNQPRFRGLGIPGNQVIITVNSTSPLTSKITVESDGTWAWRPASPLEPGVHHIGITSFDQAGNYISVTKRFIVLKSGERVLGEATASATLTPTAPASPTPSLKPIPSPTVTLIPIASPTTFIGTVSATPKVPPKTGSTRSTLIIMGAGVSLLLLGLKFLLVP